ncbi:MAG: enoyl-CoA hydratase/isomerase family protein [Marivibrio sp.]|uniref:enoyl-CoA hydratase/isomerase family protein n=1 Tax=Marivibrio sp. TaxID=2039719 RepID=UPI0032EECC32
MGEAVLVQDIGDGVRRVSLNRPDRLNAINPALLADLTAALRAADADPAVQAILLTGEGRAFCAGDDLKEFDAQAGDSEGASRTYVEAIQDVTRALVLGRTPVIGAIRGWAVGGGLEWVINCDLAVASRGTRFFFPEVSWGLFVTGAVTALLPRLVGLAKARELILFGERFEAEDAKRWGLLHDVVPEEALEENARALAARVAALPPGPVAALKRCLAYGLAAEDLERAMALETEATVAGFRDPETARRIAGF